MLNDHAANSEGSFVNKLPNEPFPADHLFAHRCLRRSCSGRYLEVQDDACSSLASITPPEQSRLAVFFAGTAVQVWYSLFLNSSKIRFRQTSGYLCCALPHPLQGEMPSIEDLADPIDQLKEGQDGEPTTMD